MNESHKKKFLKSSAALAVMASAIVVPVQAQAHTSQFSDLSSSQYFYDDVLNLQQRGIINGFEDGTFKPHANLTRGQAAKMIAGVLKLDTTNVVNPEFSDIDTTNLYYGAIAALKQEGIIDGYSDGTFKPSETIQRNHVAKILANALQLKAKNVDALPFTDVNASYKEAIAALYENNVTTGKTETTFDGKAFVTRGQMASFIVRAEKAATQAKGVTGVVDSSSDATVTIDGKNYIFDETFKSLFASSSLAGATITVDVQDDKIVAIKELKINTADTKIEADVTIDGNVIIDADNVTLKGLTITGNVELTDQVKEAVNFDKTTIKGKLITAEDQKPVANAESKSRKLLAALAPVAADTKTRLKITFENSSVAYIEIKTEDTDLNMFGQRKSSVRYGNG